MLTGLALSRFNLTPDQFFNLTPLEFFNALEDHNKRTDNSRQFQLETMRLQTLYLINANLPEHKQYKDPRVLMKFEWEKDPSAEPVEMTEQDWLDLDERMKQISDKMEKKKLKVQQ